MLIFIITKISFSLNLFYVVTVLYTTGKSSNHPRLFPCMMYNICLYFYSSKSISQIERLSLSFYSIISLCSYNVTHRNEYSKFCWWSRSLEYYSESWSLSSSRTIRSTFNKGTSTETR